MRAYRYSIWSSHCLLGRQAGGGAGTPDTGISPHREPHVCSRQGENDGSRVCISSLLPQAVGSLFHCHLA